MVCAACGQPVELTFDDEWAHETMNADLACHAYPIVPAWPAGYYAAR